MVDNELKLKNDKRKDGWELEKHSRLSCNVGSISEFLDLVKVVEDHSYTTASGFAVLATARDASASQEDAEWLIDHSEEILEEWRRFYLIFPKTTWKRTLNGICYRCFPCLKFNSGSWVLVFTDFWHKDQEFLNIRNWRFVKRTWWGPASYE